MRLKPEQLTASLAKGLAPVYLLSSDEPLQLGEMADAIRQAAKANGYENREILTVDTSFQWQELTASADSLSIFSDKKVIDLRFGAASPGADGSKAFCAYCARIPEDTLLLITIGQLKKEALKSRWFQAIEDVGVTIQAWPLEGHDLNHWLQQRLKKRGLQTDQEGLKILASRIEGNLLAAAQEIEKLYVLFGNGQITSQQMADAVADSSRFDVFKLMDVILSGNVDKLYKVLSALQAEGIAAPVVLWAITREARALIKIKCALEQGQNKDLVFRNNQVWDKRKPLVNTALNRLNLTDLNQVLIASAKADRQIKGQQAGDAWESLLLICLRFACGNTLPIAS
jgi:DNA polymerase-3 subunit delta